MSVLVVGRISVNLDEPVALAAYLSATGPLLREAGAKIIHNFSLDDALVGEKDSAESIIVVEYPSRAAVDMVFESDAYKNIIPTRDRAFITYETSIATYAT
jgi:uncharacterized protein (DUF1330 family)